MAAVHSEVVVLFCFILCLLLLPLFAWGFVLGPCFYAYLYFCVISSFEMMSSGCYSSLPFPDGATVGLQSVIVTFPGVTQLPFVLNADH